MREAIKKVLAIAAERRDHPGLLEFVNLMVGGDMITTPELAWLHEQLANVRNHLLSNRLTKHYAFILSQLINHHYKKVKQLSPTHHPLFFERLTECFNEVTVCLRKDPEVIGALDKYEVFTLNYVENVRPEDVSLLWHAREHLAINYKEAGLPREIREERKENYGRAKAYLEKFIRDFADRYIDAIRASTVRDGESVDLQMVELKLMTDEARSEANETLERNLVHEQSLLALLGVFKQAYMEQEMRRHALISDCVDRMRDVAAKDPIIHTCYQILLNGVGRFDHAGQPHETMKFSLLAYRVPPTETFDDILSPVSDDVPDEVVVADDHIRDVYNTYLHLLVLYGNESVLKHLMKREAEESLLAFIQSNGQLLSDLSDAKLTYDEGYGRSAHVPTMRYLAESPCKYRNMVFNTRNANGLTFYELKGRDGDTALHLLVKAGLFGVVRELILRCGAHPNIPNDKGEQAVKWFDQHGFAMVHRAYRDGDLELTLHLLKRAYIDFDFRTKEVGQELPQSLADMIADGLLTSSEVRAQDGCLGDFDVTSVEYRFYQQIRKLYDQHRLDHHGYHQQLAALNEKSIAIVAAFAEALQAFIGESIQGSCDDAGGHDALGVLKDKLFAHLESLMQSARTLRTGCDQYDLDRNQYEEGLTGKKHEFRLNVKALVVEIKEAVLIKGADGCLDAGDDRKPLTALEERFSSESDVLAEFALIMDAKYDRGLRDHAYPTESGSDAVRRALSPLEQDIDEAQNEVKMPNMNAGFFERMHYGFLSKKRYLDWVETKKVAKEHLQLAVFMGLAKQDDVRLFELTKHPGMRALTTVHDRLVACANEARTNPKYAHRVMDYLQEQREKVAALNLAESERCQKEEERRQKEEERRLKEESLARERALREEFDRWKAQYAPSLTEVAYSGQSNGAVVSVSAPAPRFSPATPTTAQCHAAHQRAIANESGQWHDDAELSTSSDLATSSVVP